MKNSSLPTLPPAFVSRIQHDLGSEAPAFLDSLSGRSPVSLRLNREKPGATFSGTSPVPWCETGLYLPERPSFFLDPFIYAGGYYVQEASSMLIGQWVPKDGPLKVLDLCAAPGGKSTLLASLLPPGSLLVSNEIVGSRAHILAENLDRWGFERGIVTNNHPRDFGPLYHFFDLIVVDAPCSGEGMFRKDPDTIAHWSPKMVQQCADRQRDILSLIAPCLKPGGRLVYSTCTYNSAENEEIVRWLLDSQPGCWEVARPDFPLDWGLSPGRLEFGEELGHVVHCYPHKVAGEGFFLACLEKLRPSPLPGGGRDPKKGFGSKGKGKPERGEFRKEKSLTPKVLKAAAKDFLAYPEGFEYEFLEEEGFGLPSDIAGDLQMVAKTLRPIRIGLPLGRVKGNGLIPAHGLALSRSLHLDLPRMDLSYEDALRFMKRMEPQAEPPISRDWLLATWKGLGLGWLKVVGNRMNVHLPKELRIRADLSDLLES